MVDGRVIADDLIAISADMKAGSQIAPDGSVLLEHIIVAQD